VQYMHEQHFIPSTVPIEELFVSLPGNFGH